MGDYFGQNFGNKLSFIFFELASISGIISIAYAVHLPSCLISGTVTMTRATVIWRTTDILGIDGNVLDLFSDTFSTQILQIVNNRHKILCADNLINIKFHEIEDFRGRLHITIGSLS